MRSSQKTCLLSADQGDRRFGLMGVLGKQCGTSVVNNAIFMLKEINFLGY